MTDPRVVKALMVMGEIYSKNVSEAAAGMILDDLSGQEPDAILAALKKCRLELSRFPTVSDIVSRIQQQDGRPGVEEAWAMVPKSEADSAVVNDEIMTAWGTVRDLIQAGDLIAARMGFREAYLKIVDKNREQKKPVNWFATLGHDKTARETVIRDALEKNRLTHSQAEALLPDKFNNPNQSIKLLLQSFTNEIPEKVKT